MASSIFLSKVSSDTYDMGGESVFSQIDSSVFADTVVASTSSFKYDLANSGIKSSQQLGTDFSQFQNHTFFNSAEVNVNIAFDKIINNYPFDGTNAELESWSDSLSGFEKYVFNQFPKQKGYLFFSGTYVGEDSTGTKGTFIIVNDKSGMTQPGLSRIQTAQPVLDFGTGSVTYELWLYLPKQINANQVVIQKINQSDNTRGIILGVSQSALTSSANIYYSICSGSSELSVSASVDKGTFNHICATYNKDSGLNKLQLFINETLKTESSAANLGILGAGFTQAPLLIGSGTALSTTFIPEQTLSGAVDELRIYGTTVSVERQKSFAEKSIFSSDDLKLYFKFNEPTGSWATGSTVRTILDSSGKSLHSQICPYAFSILRIKDIDIGIDIPMTYEMEHSSPILFPSHPKIVSLNQKLLNSASVYDKENPSLITKLIPENYLLQGQLQESLNTIEGEIVNDYSYSEDGPSGGNLGATQLLLSLLYVYAKFFDELKISIDSFSDLFFADYDANVSTPDAFLQFFAKHCGITLPPLFTSADISQFINAENIDQNISTNQYTLQYIQNQVWRRLLTNIKDIVKSKGTIYSIKAFLRTLGIDPDSHFRIREFGGPTKFSLTNSRENKTEVSSMIYLNSGSLIISPFLSGSRVEPGLPTVQGVFVSGSSNNINDGLFTSGSWTYEGLYKLPKYQIGAPMTASLVRLHTVGLTWSPLMVNIVATSHPNPEVTLYAQSIINTTPLKITLPNTNIFDGENWYISVGRKKYNEIPTVCSSSYYIRCVKQNSGEIVETHVSSSYYEDGTTNDYFSLINSSYNISGSFLAIGSSSIDVSAKFLNNSTYPNICRYNIFSGSVSQMRFWSKYLDDNEWKEHALNYSSMGATNPELNFNFVSSESGSFGKIRLDVSTEQDVVSSDGTGNIELFDFSQHNNHCSGSGFTPSTLVIKPEQINFSYISPKFDESSTTNKIRVRSYLEFENAVQEGDYAGIAPIYSIRSSEQPIDNTRFSIDFSVVDALDKDIMKIFSTLDCLDNIIGSPELMFSPDYPRLETLRNIYFNRLTGDINLKGFFDFFRWFDLSIGSFISQLLPRNTKYFGTNFVIESSCIERNKVEYQYADIYVGETNRANLQGNLLLQQIIGNFKRY